MLFWIQFSNTVLVVKKGSWSLGDDFARVAIIFCVDSSPIHTGNCKNSYLVLGKRPSHDINDSVAAAEKRFSINYTKAKVKFCLSLPYNGENSYLFVNG